MVKTLTDIMFGDSSFIYEILEETDPLSEKLGFFILMQLKKGKSYINLYQVLCSLSRFFFAKSVESAQQSHKICMLTSKSQQICNLGSSLPTCE